MKTKLILLLVVVSVALFVGGCKATWTGKDGETKKLGWNPFFPDCSYQNQN